MELSPFEFLDSWADLIPPPRKHRHRDQGAFAPNHPLRPAVTAPAIGNAAKQGDEPPCGHAGRTQAAYAYCDSGVKPPPHGHVADCLGQALGAGGGGVSPRVSELRRRHPADRVHQRACTPSARSSRTSVSRSSRLPFLRLTRAAHRLEPTRAGA